MKKFLLFLLLNLPMIAQSQVVLGQVDNFEDFTMRNWTKNNSIPNANIYDGGPTGAGDNFLRVTSSGSGSNLNLMTKNNAQWRGNYYQGNLASRIKYISMDVRNSGTEVIFLRLSFQTDYGIIYRGSTTNAIAVLPNEGWKKISFSILESNITAITSTFDYAVLFGSGSEGVEEMRILHSSVPSWEAEPIVATLDIDNIMAESQALGTNEFRTGTSVKLYPNPASDIITIYSDTNTVESFTYNIIDLAGRVVKSGNAELNHEINIQDLNPGNYILQLKTENGITINEKLLKK